MLSFMQDSGFQSFLRRREHQPMVEVLQRKQMRRSIKAHEKHNAKEFRAKVTKPYFLKQKTDSAGATISP